MRIDPAPYINQCQTRRGDSHDAVEMLLQFLLLPLLLGQLRPQPRDFLLLVLLQLAVLSMETKKKGNVKTELADAP